MGCDIHAAIEYRLVGENERALRVMRRMLSHAPSGWTAHTVPNPWYPQWEDEQPTTANLHLDRIYSLFAVLAGVRNDYGEHFVPISEPRGYPEDISPEADAVMSKEHSATWLTFRELTAVTDERRSSILRGGLGKAWAAMEQLSEQYGPDNVRLVMDFDS